MLRLAFLVLALKLSPLWCQNPVQANGRHVVLILEQASGNEWKQVDPHTVFDAGSEIRFRFRANFGGYLYTLNETSAGERLWLFPTPETGVDNRIEADKEYVVPATSGSFVIPRNAGYDIVYWIVNPATFAEVPQMPRRRQYPQHTYSTLKPRCRESTLKARGLCLDGQAGASPVTDPSDLAPLVPRGSLQARSPDFSEDAGQSRISVIGPDSGPFIYQFRVAHR